MNSYNPPGYQPKGSKRNSKLPKGGTGQNKPLIQMEMQVATVDNNGAFKNADINIWVSKKDAEIISEILNRERPEQRFDIGIKYE